jgi:hypothetical protein
MFEIRSSGISNKCMGMHGDATPRVRKFQREIYYVFFSLFCNLYTYVCDDIYFLRKKILRVFPT